MHFCAILHRSLFMFHDDEGNIVVNTLFADKEHEVSNDSVLDAGGAQFGIGLEAIAEAVEAIHFAVIVFCFCDAIGVEDSDIALIEWDFEGFDEVGDIFLEADWKAEVDGRDAFEGASAADDEDILVLAGESEAIVLIVGEEEGEVFIGLYAGDVLKESFIELVEEANGVVFTGVEEGAGDGLDHNHKDAAFDAVPSDVANADFDEVFVE